MTNKILIVDDDINILYGFRRRLRKHFAIHTVRNGDEALAALDAEGPFAIVVSDMRMPGMDGVQLLSEFRQRAPDTVRIMFTGHGDRETAVDAVNRGRISRFLAKPCSTEILKQALEEGLEEFRRKTRKREPEATDGLTGVFSRRAFLQAAENELKRARRFSRPMAVGLLAIDGFKDVVHGHGPGAGEGVLRGVAETVEGIPELGGKFIANIPRLGEVAKIVRYHTKCFNGDGFPEDGLAGRDIPYEARILKVLYDLAEGAETDHPTPDRFDILAKRRGHYDPAVLADVKGILAVSDPQAKEFAVEPIDVTATMLVEGDVLRRDLETLDERLILAEGAKLKLIQIERIRGFVRLGILQEPIEILRRKVTTPIASEVQW